VVWKWGIGGIGLARKGKESMYDLTIERLLREKRDGVASI
jgi:hypothetical protein